MDCLTSRCVPAISFFRPCGLALTAFFNAKVVKARTWILSKSSVSKPRATAWRPSRMAGCKLVLELGFKCLHNAAGYGFDNLLNFIFIEF